MFLPIRNADICIVHIICKYLEKLYNYLTGSRNIRQCMDKPTAAYPSSIMPSRTKRTTLLTGLQHGWASNASCWVKEARLQVYPVPWFGKCRSVEEKDIWVAAWGLGLEYSLQRDMRELFRERVGGKGQGEEEGENEVFSILPAGTVTSTIMNICQDWELLDKKVTLLHMT